MKKLLCLVGVMMLMASVAPAQVDPDPDGLGVYFSATEPVRCGTAMPGMYTVYVAATNISCATLAGWECKVVCNNPMWMFLSATLYGLGPIGLFTPPVFQVGLGVPMEATPFMVLASCQYFVQDMNPTAFFIDRIQYQSVAGENAVYADGADVGNLVPFHSPQADWSLPVAYANTPNCTTVAIEDETWGSVKGMFK